MRDIPEVLTIKGGEREVTKTIMFFHKWIPKARRLEAQREIHALTSLQHPQIPRLLAVVEGPAGWLLVETFIPGETLGALARRGKTWSLEEIVDLAEQLCDLLDYTQTSGPVPVLHLDLHPDNLLLHHGRIHLVDFGQAWCGRILSERDRRCGTPPFAAPELYGPGPVDERVDLFAVGTVIRWLLSTSAIPDAEQPKWLTSLVRVCTREDPAKRILAAGDLAKRLRDGQRLLSGFDPGTSLMNP